MLLLPRRLAGCYTVINNYQGKVSLLARYFIPTVPHPSPNKGVKKSCDVLSNDSRQYGSYGRARRWCLSLARSHRFMSPAVSRKAGDGAVVQRSAAATTVAGRPGEFGELRKYFWLLIEGRGRGSRYRR